MSVLKQSRFISIAKTLLFCVLELLWCISENRRENLIFIILAAVLIATNAIKIVFTAIELPKILRVVSLIFIWLTELIVTTALLTLLYYITGFDLYDFLAFFATFIIVALLIAEVGIFVKFLKSEIR